MIRQDESDQEEPAHRTASTWQKAADSIAANSQSVLLENLPLKTRLTACFSFSCSRRYPLSWREFGRGRSAVRQVPMSMSDQPTSMASALPMVDILPLVLQHLSEDLASLCVCALLNHNSNRAASAVLYRNITFAPPWTRTLDLNEAQKYSVRSQHVTIVHRVISHHR